MKLKFLRFIFFSIVYYISWSIHSTGVILLEKMLHFTDTNSKNISCVGSIQCSWERAFEIALENLIILIQIIQTYGMVLHISITKLTLSSECLLHPLTALLLDLGVNNILFKNPLHNIFGCLTCTHPVLERKNKAHLFLPLDKRSSATCCFVSVSRKEKWKKCGCSKSCYFLVWKKEFPGFLCMEKGLSVILFTSSNLQLYD